MKSRRCTRSTTTPTLPTLEEGLILTEVRQVPQDGEPRNNFLTRALTWNEGDVLKGARYLTIAGTHFYVSWDAGVVELDMDDPLHPKVMAVIPIEGAQGTMVQFRYLFVAGAGGTPNGVDITDPSKPVILDSARVAARPRQSRLRLAHLSPMRRRKATGSPSSMSSGPIGRSSTMQYNADGKLGDVRDVVYRLDQRLALRLCRRRQGRAQGAAAHLAREPAELLRLLARAQARVDCLGV